MKRIVVLASGNGSNLQAIMDAFLTRETSGNVAAVFSDNAAAYALTRARKAGIAGHALSLHAFPTREAFDQQLLHETEVYAPDVVVLAGYMRILSPLFVGHYAGRLLNIHPSLLPKYPGLHTHRQALAAGDKQHGCTVHFVTEELDGGPVIVQATVPVLTQDTEQTLAARVQQQEHRIYPQVIDWFLQGRLQMRNARAWLDNRCLPPTGAVLPS